MLRVGIIGAGNIIPQHLKAIQNHPQTQLCAVADIVLERAQASVRPYGANAYADYKEMLAQEKPDAVIINLPHWLHEECAVACARHKAAVLLEKPMSVSYASCERINRVFDEEGVYLQIGHVQRYAADNRAARELIASGVLGELVMISQLRATNYFVPERPRWFLNKATAGGGIWINYGAHALDKLCFLTGSNIENITGHCTYHGEGADVDGSAQIYVKMQSGVTGTITLCGYSVVPVDETMIYLTKGSLKLCSFEGLWIAKEGKYEQVDVSAYPWGFDVQWDDFVKGLKNGAPLHCDGAYGAEIMRRIESIWDKDV